MIAGWANQTVVVERGVITALGPAGSVRVPANARRVDGRNKFLMPGLADMHVHLHGNPPSEYPDVLELFIPNGVTTVLVLKGVPEGLRVRADVARGRGLGPTVFMAGPFVNEPFVRTPEEVERAVIEQKRAGYDFVKLHGDLTAQSYARLMSVARREGIRVVGHAPRNLGLAPMFRERQYAVVHAEEFLYDTTNSSRDFAQVEGRIPQLARSMKDAGIWLMPNLTAYKAIGEMVQNLDASLARPEVRYLPASSQQQWSAPNNAYTNRFPPSNAPGIFARLRVLEKLTLGFQRAGVRLLVGTDAMNTGVVPGWSTHDELELFVQAGLTPYEALRTATANAADFLAVPGQRGIVAVGQKADLLLLEANPLDRIQNTRAIAGVILRGRWLPKSELRKLLERD